MDLLQQLAVRLALANAMANELTDYLRGNDLYQHMRVETPQGSQQVVMTLGALLEHMQILTWHEADLNAGQTSQLAAIRSKVGHDRTAFPEQWHAFLRRELKASLDSWKWYLDDLAEKPRSGENYPSEVHLRTRIALLIHELDGDPAAAEGRERVAGLDTRLKGALKGNAYVGPEEGQGHYSPDETWWLFGKP